MRLKPGVYTTKSEEKNTTKTSFTFDNSISGGEYAPQMQIRYVPDSSEFKIAVKRGKKSEEFNGINFLREVGFNDTQIKKMMGNGSHADIVFERTGNRKGKSVHDIYNVLTGMKVSPAENKELVASKIFEFTADNAKFGTGTNVVKDNLGVKTDHFNKEVLQQAVAKTFNVAIDSEVNKPDDVDDLRFKDVLTDNDFIIGELAKDFDTFKKNTIELLKSDKKISARSLNPGVRHLGTSLNRFMSAGSVIQAPEQINPLYVAATDKKITQLGEGGLNSMTITEGSRNLAKVSFNRIDPIETPESGNIGVVEHLSQAATIKNGTIYAPFLKVKDGVVIGEYLR
jgi:DNA-directed RNA polymerase beta subunit